MAKIVRKTIGYILLSIPIMLILDWYARGTGGYGALLTTTAFQLGTIVFILVVISLLAAGDE